MRSYLQFQRLLIVSIGFAIKIFVIVYGFEFYKVEREYSPIENGIYAATHRSMYVLFEAFVGVVGFTTGFGNTNSKLTIMYT